MNSSETDESISTASCSSAEFSHDPNKDRNRTSWPNLSIICERFQLSDRAGATVANAAIKDLEINNILSCKSNAFLVDRSKLRRERTKFRQEAVLRNEENASEINGIHVDGRKDAALVQEQLTNKFKRKVATKRHYVIIGEPGAIYLTRVTLDNGRGKIINKTVF